MDINTAINPQAEENTTIAAIATSRGEAGIGIVRVSGPDAFTAVAPLYGVRRGGQLVCPLSEYAHGSIHHGYLTTPDGEAVDEIMISVFKAPHSYTTEDTVEINVHGGDFMLQRALELVLAQGVVLAEPGEFTKRAFMGGRIDLAQAEAVMELIRARSEFARRTAMEQLSGRLSGVVRDIRGQILYETAFIESALDDPDNYDTEGYDEALRPRVESARARIRELLAHADEGRILKEGIPTAILGAPNVGKSSLLNLLYGAERAIVTEIPGTTRDTLEETVRLDEFCLRLTDTAGIRESGDTVESIGIRRAMDAAEKAELCVVMLDGTKPHLPAEIETLLVSKEKKALILINKWDKVLETRGTGPVKDGTAAEANSARSDAGSPDGGGAALEALKKRFGDSYPVLLVSVKQDKAYGETEEDLIRALGSAIRAVFPLGTYSESDRSQEVLVTSLRHKEALVRADESLKFVLETMDRGLSEDFYSGDLMDAYTALGEILGESLGDDLAEEIFTKFCLGK